jgi:hypothetical protein
MEKITLVHHGNWRGKGIRNTAHKARNMHLHQQAQTYIVCVDAYGDGPRLRATTFADVK